MGRVHPSPITILAYSLSSKTGQGFPLLQSVNSTKFCNLSEMLLQPSSKCQPFRTTPDPTVPMRICYNISLPLCWSTKESPSPQAINIFGNGLWLLHSTAFGHSVPHFSMLLLTLVGLKCTSSWCTVPYWAPNFIMLALAC